MKTDFNEKFHSFKLIIQQYLNLYDIPVDYGLYCIYFNKKKYPNITIIFYYNRYIHEEKYIYSVHFDNYQSGSCCPCDTIDEVLCELKRLCNTYFKNYKKKYIKLSLFDLN